MENSSGVKTWQWVVTVIVIIVIIIIGIMVFGGNSGTTPVTTEQTPTPTVEETSGYKIVMSDQYPGNVVYLSSVQAASPTWIVIQTDKNGLPDKVIGSAHFGAGINPGKVTLTQPMVDGATYYAVFYTDDGNDSLTPNDQPRKDANGQVIMKVFKASSSASAGFKE